MTYDEFNTLLAEAVDSYNGDNLPEFSEKIDNVRAGVELLKEEYVPKAEYVPKVQYDNLANDYKKRYKLEYFGTAYEPKPAAVEELTDPEETAAEVETSTEEETVEEEKEYKNIDEIF